MIFNMRKWTVLVAVFSIAAGVLSAEPASPVREVMQGFVDRKVISGGVTIVANKDKLLQLEAVGYSDLAKREAMREDHLFWIASMTKPMAAVCVLRRMYAGCCSRVQIR